MLYLIYLFFMAAVFFITFGILSSVSEESQRRQVWQRLPVESAQIKKVRRKAYFAPLFALSNFLLEKLRLKERLCLNLEAAHVKLEAEEFFSLKLLLMIIFALLTYFIFGKIHPPALVIGLILGYSILDIWLNRKISRLKQAIVRLLPETVDLMALCMEAGLDFTSTVDWIVRRTKPTPLLQELALVLEEIKLGKPRAKALKDMAKRLNLMEVTSFVLTLVQAERMGTPVVEAFSIISEDTRLQRFHRGERFALKAPLKMLIPLIFCILPAIVIIIGAPILIQFTQGGLFR